eukprot:362540-Chlamydomonas_euryale.AAC.3
MPSPRPGRAAGRGALARARGSVAQGSAAGVRSASTRSVDQALSLLASSHCQTSRPLLRRAALMASRRRAARCAAGVCNLTAAATERGEGKAAPAGRGVGSWLRCAALYPPQLMGRVGSSEPCARLDS